MLTESFPIAQNQHSRQSAYTPLLDSALSWSLCVGTRGLRSSSDCDIRREFAARISSLLARRARLNTFVGIFPRHESTQVSTMHLSYIQQTVRVLLGLWYRLRNCSSHLRPDEIPQTVPEPLLGNA